MLYDRSGEKLTEVSPHFLDSTQNKKKNYLTEAGQLYVTLFHLCYYKVILYSYLLKL